MLSFSAKPPLRGRLRLPRSWEKEYLGHRTRQHPSTAPRAPAAATAGASPAESRQRRLRQRGAASPLGKRGVRRGGGGLGARLAAEGEGDLLEAGLRRRQRWVLGKVPGSFSWEERRPCSAGPLRFDGCRLNRLYFVFCFLPPHERTHICAHL